MISQIGVRLQVEGFHFWKDAPSQVAFLRDRHRHIFHIECLKSVNHDDRDTEFILLKRQIEKYLRNEYCVSMTPIHEFGGMSCEMIAKELVGAFDLDQCTVSEDGENFGRVTR